MSFSPDLALTGKALTMAWETRGKPADVMYHSDHGSQTVIMALSYKAKHESTRELLGQQPNGTIFPQPEIRMCPELWIR